MSEWGDLYFSYASWLLYYIIENILHASYARCLIRNSKPVEIDSIIMSHIARAYSVGPNGHLAFWFGGAELALAPHDTLDKQHLIRDLCRECSFSGLVNVWFVCSDFKCALLWSFCS